MNAYDIVLTLHNIVRWLVVLAGLMAASRALFGWFAGRPWTKTDDRLGLLYMVSLDIQVLLGLILYFFLSPITRDALRDFGAAMSDTNARFWSVEHITIMLVVFVLVHLGRVLSRRGSSDLSKNRRAAIFYTLTLIMLVLGMPWARPLLPTF
jgi:hypothetical protein